MTTRIAVYNGALAALGEPPITQENAPGAAPLRLRSLYASVVRSLFEQHPWNFAQTATALAPNAPANPDPDYPTQPIGWDYAFNKPANCWRILRVNRTGRLEDPSIPFDDAGGQLLANEAEPYLLYVDAKWLTLEGAWPEVFARAVELELAKRASPATTNNRGKGADLSVMAREAMRIAKTWDSQQKPHQRMPDGAYVRARMAWPARSRNRENG